MVEIKRQDVTTGHTFYISEAVSDPITGPQLFKDFIERTPVPIFMLWRGVATTRYLGKGSIAFRLQEIWQKPAMGEHLRR
ncbi:hypothetical protein SBA1_550117 [Candidatus Sulfotelmatobacter kueseliae]|uniref:Uncharacterized protein n=1 Tax=Candidatus Sulfotelmatobacter kueseliae TaxID=2042962 RepID=A0A2U3KYP2_9BACT|nr:hypothetical protein SBA1_550117 [Candidatus Sulfotelmatobacter kueseliae]